MSRLKLTVKQTSFDIYIIIVLFFVLPTFTTVHGYTFPNKKQEEFVKSLGSYEFALPNRVTRDGKFISKEIYPHHARLKRSIENERVAEDDVHYKINVESEDLHLELKPNYKLYNPSLVLEHRKNNFKNVSDSTFSRYHHANEHCHFVGEIRGQPSSKVALELCNGLRGLIHTHKDAYFIEPIQGHKSINSTGHPHIIYKHSSLSSLLGYSELLEKTEDTDACGNNENKVVMNFEQKRTRWEKRNRRNQSRQRRRHKRSISVERHVETLVVVDPDMMSYYKNEDVITYVLTVMNMVATLFHDASIGNAINIVVVRIMLLEDPQHDLKITNHADKSLRSFCKWQTKINMKGDEHANHHDVAVLLTRKDICARMNAPCSTLGLAQTMGMCQPHRSCNINEDTGLALAYTVAHEIGHNLGMRHDSKRNGCQLKDSDEFVYIMTAHLVAVSPLMKWSNCSKRSITKFIDRGWAYCLDDEPVKYRDSRSYEYPVLPPGTMYDGDHQCRLAYGHDAFVCEGGKDDICNTLWCRTNNKCSTKFEAAAEGTICGVNKWCFREQCVEIGDRPQAINGNWGEWSEWSSCTRTCGAGVSSRERHCDNPQPSNGGKFCIGERKRYRICNTDQCQEKKKSFRQAQCEEFNYIPFKNGLYEWEAVNTPATPCQLHCKPRNKFFSVMLRDIVTDGTPCTAGTRNMCISGRCRHIGCDWEIDSSAREDRCGVCHGDGSTCETIKDQYNETQGFGYVEATVIPKHARNIRVEEIKEANNYLAVQNDNGEYYLNGHWFIQWSGDYDMAGTVVHYQRVGNKEKFEAVGPLKEPLHIMLLLQSHNPGVMFEYTVPKQNATDTRPRHFEWKYMDWTHCTSSCGGGTQRAEVVCVEKEAGNVDDVYCNTTTKPDDRQRACNVHLCPARWWAGPWQHCSVSCGENGVHRRTVICVRSLGSDEQIALEDKSCRGEEKPTEIEKCHHKQLCPGTAKWVTGEWTECNDNPCSNKTRSVTCEDPVIGCDKNPKPKTAVPCTNITCGEWAVGEWSQCNTTCGAGVRHRIITCRGSAVCDVDKRPINEEICNMGDCPTTPPVVVTTVKVPVTTESISEMTTVDIYNIAEESDILFNKEEKHNNRKSNQLNSFDKNDKNEHNNNIADNHLLNEPSKIKQSIVKETINKNSENVGERKSNGSAGTDIVEKVVLGNQTFEIAEGGTGEPERQVLLGSDSETKVKDNKKNKQQSEVINGSSTREQTTVSSSITSQSSHTMPPKQDILKSNKNGMKNSKYKKKKLNHHHRHGHGKKNKGDKAPSVPLSDITRLSRIRGGRMGPLLPPKDPPPMSMDKIIKNRLRKPSIPGSAIVASVFEWSQRNWTVCTRQCGGGVQTRPVLCVNSKTNEEVHTARCNILTKPNAIRPCNRQKCAQWQASEWSACSTTCGTAVQRRDVKCPENSYCDPKHRPSRIRTCRNPDCLAWIHGQWSKCSKTCGTGEQIRVVQCVNLTSQQQTTGCGLSTRPDEGQECNKQACPEEKSELQRSICKNNRMSDRVCRVLKKRGHCKRLFVRVNCCRECEIDKLKKNRSHRRVQR